MANVEHTEILDSRGPCLLRMAKSLLQRRGRPIMTDLGVWCDRVIYLLVRSVDMCKESPGLELYNGTMQCIGLSMVLVAAKEV